MDRVTFFFGGWEPVARILVVGTLAYVALVLLLRASGKRTLAQMNAFDFVITVAVGASFGRLLTARSVALVEAVAAFVLLVSLQSAMAWLQVRFPGFARAVTTPPSLLFFRGRILRDALRRERISEAELEAVVREHGVGSFDEVEAIVLESDGRFAVVKAKQAGDGSALRSIRNAE
jgi:uncharacterized membrane protein YcaP (DUF421 family)